MIESVDIKRFRCFEKLKVDGFNTVNIISGQNNVGKTSLLEAIFLSLGNHNPGLPRVIDRFRGVVSSGLNAGELWGWLFNDHDANSDIQIECRYGDGNTSVLRIYLSRHEETSYPQLDLIDEDTSNGGGESSTLENSSQLTLEYLTPGQDSVPSVAFEWLEGEELKQRIAEPQGVGGVFLTPKMNHAEVNATRFSKLKDRQEEAPVLEAL